MGATRLRAAGSRAEYSCRAGEAWLAGGERVVPCGCGARQAGGERMDKDSSFCYALLTKCWSYRNETKLDLMTTLSVPSIPFASRSGACCSFACCSFASRRLVLQIQEPLRYTEENLKLETHHKQNLCCFP
jgi:hypothetical protein